MSPTSHAAATPVVEIENLVKTFGRGESATRALDGLNLAVAPGEVVGFLGPNGAGKTTTLRILLAMLRADSGTAALFGQDPWKNAVTLHQRLAYVPGDVALWPGLTGGQTIESLASLRKDADSADTKKRQAELIERFDLDPSKKVRTYSKGNRQKVALIAALSADVDLLVLDEPTSGLDPLMEETFRQCVVEAKDRGTAVLLSSHILSEVESLCDAVTIVRAGKTVESGSLARIRSLLRTQVHAAVKQDPAGLAANPATHDVVITPPQDATAEGAGAGWQVSLSVDSTDMDAVTRELAALGVNSLTAAPPSLEELFLRHYDTATAADGAA